MAKVFLGVGHGGKDPGAVGYLREEDVNLTMALACRDYLVANSVEVLMSRTIDEDDPLSEVIKECNAFKPDLCADIHVNSGRGDGFEVFYHHLGGNSKKLAQNIEKEVLAIGQNSRGCKTKVRADGQDYYGFIRQTDAPAVITEGLFVDNKKDVQIADTIEEQKAFGVAYAKGMITTLKEMGKIVSQQTNTQTPTAETLRYKVGDKVVVSSYYASSTDEPKKAIHKTATGTITRLVEGAINPYLLNDGDIGWCNDGDIRGLANKNTKTLSVGSKVKIKKSASTYCTGQKIPSTVKNKSYTVMQIGSNKYKNGILLKEIISWVNRSDLEY